MADRTQLGSKLHTQDDPLYGKYAAEYNNPSTSPARKAQIGAVWGFSGSSVPPGKQNIGLKQPGLKGDAKTAVTGNVASNAVNNPNVTGPLGGQNITYDANGVPTVNNTYSQGNLNAINSIQGQGVNAGNVLGGLLGSLGSLSNPSTPGTNGQPGNAAPMSNYENSIYQQLTNRLGQQQQVAQGNAEQTLSNRGIPYGSDAWNNQIRDQVTNPYADQYANAGAQAVQLGTNASLSGIGTLSNVNNSGFINPQNPGFAGSNDVASIMQAINSGTLGQGQLALAKQKLAAATATTAPPAFNQPG